MTDDIEKRFRWGKAIVRFGRLQSEHLDGTEKLKALLAPIQTELPFLITQVVVLALFVVLTVVALIRFHGESKEPGRFHCRGSPSIPVDKMGA